MQEGRGGRIISGGGSVRNRVGLLELGWLVSMVIQFQNVRKIIELYVQGWCVIHNEKSFFDG